MKRKISNNGAFSSPALYPILHVDEDEWVIRLQEVKEPTECRDLEQ